MPDEPLPGRRTRLARALLLTQLTSGQRRVVEEVASGKNTAAAAEALGMTRQGAHKLWLSACEDHRTPAVFQTAAAAELDVSSLPQPRATVRQSHDVIRARAREGLRALEANGGTDKQRAALENLAEHGNIRRTARECGCSAVTVHSALRRFSEPIGTLHRPFDSDDLEACAAPRTG